MAQDDQENITNTQRRFEIFVPSPKARINLGAPNKTATGPFGYTGLSLQSDVHLFIDANKHTLFQTGQHYCGQVGGKWLQYSNADMFMSSLTNVNLSADKKVLLAAGAGQGQITALDHGNFPRVVSYNALGLAYRLDRIQVGLYEFFHGRRTKAEYSGKWATFLSTFGVEDLEYFHGDKKSKAPRQTTAGLNGGFFGVTKKSLSELFPVETERNLGEYDADAANEPDPIVLLDPLVMKGVVKGNDDASKLRYGISPYFNRFDPYQLIDVSAVKGGLIVKGFATFRNGLAWMRRFADVCTKYAYLITDNKLGERAQALTGSVDHLAKATSHAYHFVELPFGHFMAGANRGIGSGAGSGGFQDELSSGAQARFSGGSPGGAADAGGERERARFDAERAALKAKVTSEEGPFDLSAHPLSYWTLTIETEDGASKTITLGGSPPSPASLSGTIDVPALLPAEADVTVGRPRDGSVPHWISDAELNEWIAEELGLSSPPSSWTVPVSVSADLMTELLTVAWRHPDSFYQRTRRFEERSGTHATVALHQVMRLMPVHRDEEVRLGVDGTEVSVRLQSARLSFSPDPLKRAADQQYVRDQIAAAAGSAGASVSGSDETFTIESGRTGAQAELLVIDGPNPVLRGLGLRRAQRAIGSEGSSGLSGQDLTSVTLEQIAAEIGSSSSFTASMPDPSALVIESAHAPDVGDPSRVTVRGTLQPLLFSTARDEQTWDQDRQDEEDYYADLAEREEFYKSLISWNHELQKLPEDTRNLTRPIRNAVNDVVAAATELEKMAEGIADFVGQTEGLPSPPEAIGLIADEGITLGTRDRIVGAGGRGIVFIADGGSGHEDQNRFVPTVEQFVNLSMAIDPVKAAVKGVKLLFGASNDQANPPEPEPAPSLGFRVMSNSTVDLMGTNSAQLMALGRGKLNAAGPDGETIVGTGIARVAGSYATEVAAYRKVVISARNRGDDDKTGGRVEVAGQTIAIGGVNLDGDTTDFESDPAKAERFGIQPLDVSDFAGSEHLSPVHKDAVKKELLAHAWPERLRDGGPDGHPDTQRVLVHAAKESVVQIGTYYIHIDAEKGVTIGTRTPNADPTVNVIDQAKPSIQIQEDKVRVSMGKTDEDSTLLLEKDRVLLFEGPTNDHPARAQLQLKKGVAKLYGGNSFFEAKQGKLAIYADNLDTSRTKNIKMTASGTIKIG